MDNKEDKLTDLAEKKPGLALVYGMAVVISVLSGVVVFQNFQIEKLQRDIRTISDNFQKREDKIRAEAQFEVSAQFEKRIEQYESAREKEEKRILELSGKFDAILSKATSTDSKFDKIEKKVKTFSGETQKIEEIIQK
ncbi:hypothetical protein [Dyadobacter sp. CY323]|uniref:hypothetical protein n=1 Tax=Dyadobacter sp. CY323 TaxID=2907302 RepID=UPI001F25D116|nr:hypothetical protein [Dyadobacter sp. CY323]MCE6992112.1 hypothetical protein [Dyadobacter sp. CY323]